MADLFGHPDTGLPKRYHKTDWSAEEKRFKEMLPEFIRRIAVANPEVHRDTPERDGKEILTSQAVVSEDFVLSTDKLQEENEKYDIGFVYVSEDVTLFGKVWKKGRWIK